MDFPTTEEDNDTTQRFIVFKLLSIRLAKEMIKNKQAKPSEKGYRNITLPLFKDGETDTRRGEVACSKSLKPAAPLAGLLKAGGSCNSERAPSALPSPAALLAAGCCVIEQCVFPK